jgi:GntR family transcriptional regulator
MSSQQKPTEFPITTGPSLSERICKELEGQIRSGVLKPGERLPSESEFARKLGVSRNSYREALSLLEKSALVVRRHGIGTFVTANQPLIRGGIENLRGVLQMIESRGLKSRSDIIAFQEEYFDQTIEAKLDLEPGTPLVYLETLKSANNWPVAVCVDLVPGAYLGEIIDPNDLNASIFDGLQEYHQINIRFAECDIIPIVADAELADKLKVERKTPLLLLSQIHFDETNRKVLYSKSYFPFDRFTFKLIRRR